MRVTQHDVVLRKRKLVTVTGYWGNHMTDLNQMSQTTLTDINFEEKTANIDQCK